MELDQRRRFEAESVTKNGAERLRFFVSMGDKGSFSAEGACLPLGEGAPVRTLGRMRANPGEAGKTFFCTPCGMAMNCGMIAIGNHNDSKFAAGCSTLISHQNRFRRTDFGASFPQGKPWAAPYYIVKQPFIQPANTDVGAVFPFAFLGKLW